MGYGGFEPLRSGAAPEGPVPCRFSLCFSFRVPFCLVRMFRYGTFRVSSHTPLCEKKSNTPGGVWGIRTPAQRSCAGRSGSAPLFFILFLPGPILFEANVSARDLPRESSHISMWKKVQHPGWGIGLFYAKGGIRTHGRLLAEHTISSRAP